MITSNIYKVLMDCFKCYKSVEALYNSQRIVCGWVRYNEFNASGEYDEIDIVLSEGYSLSELEDFLEKTKELDFYRDYVDFQIWNSNNHLIFSDVDDCGNCHAANIYVPVVPRNLASK